MAVRRILRHRKVGGERAFHSRLAARSAVVDREEFIEVCVLSDLHRRRGVQRATPDRGAGSQQ